MVLASNITSTFLAHQLQFFPFGLGSMILRSHSGVYESKRIGCSGGFSSVAGLTLRSSRTPPALSSALSQLFAISASFSASVQAGPLSFIR